MTQVVRQSSPPNLRRPIADLRKPDFDDFVFNHGYDVLIDRNITCPCSVESNSSNKSSCRNCGGSGYVFLNRYSTKVAVQSMNVDTQFKEWSKERLGTARITSLDDAELSFMDRITIIDLETIHNERLYFHNYNLELKASLIYPPLEIMEAFLFINSTTPLQRLELGTDYTVTDNIITLNRRFNVGEPQEYLDVIKRAERNSDIIESRECIRGDLFNPVFESTVDDPVVSFRYKHYPQYHVIDLPRDSISTRNNNRDGERQQTLPTHAIARLSHYVLTDQGINVSPLIDNKYTASSKSTGARINSNILRP